MCVDKSAKLFLVGESRIKEHCRYDCVFDWSYPIANMSSGVVVALVTTAKCDIVNQ